MNALTVGILPQEQMRARVRSIAAGGYKPAPDEPKIWFTSLTTLAAVLSDDNRALLKIIRDREPASIATLAELCGQRPGRLSRALKLLSNYGMVELKRERGRIRPIVYASEFLILA